MVSTMVPGMILKIKQKNYQNCHYYYAISNADYVIPPAPNVEKIRAIERTFHTMQDRFMEWTHSYKSFFSYNWLLRTLLVQENLPFYLQFVKKIKCKKRVLVYEKMWEFFTIIQKRILRILHIFGPIQLHVIIRNARLQFLF